MRSFGTNEYGNKDGFKIICQSCGNEAQLVPTHRYSDGDYTNPAEITLEIRCICGNKFGARIHSK